MSLQQVREDYLAIAFHANNALAKAVESYPLGTFDDMHSFCVARAELERVFVTGISNIDFPDEVANDVSVLLSLEAGLIARLESCSKANTSDAIRSVLFKSSPTADALALHNAAAQVRQALDLRVSDGDVH